MAELSMFLSREELAEFTGFKYRPEQLRWLSNRGYKYELDRTGRPKVLRAAIVAALGGPAEAQPQERRTEPNWDFFKKQTGGLSHGEKKTGQT